MSEKQNFCKQQGFTVRIVIYSVKLRVGTTETSCKRSIQVQETKALRKRGAVYVCPDLTIRPLMFRL